MTLPEPSDTIAPRDDHPYDTADILGEVFIGAYPSNVGLYRHGIDRQPTQETTKHD